MFRKFLLAVLLVLIVGVAGLTAVWKGLDWYGNQPLIPVTGEQELEFSITPGSSLSRVADDLASRGWLDYPRAFTLMARLNKLAGGIQAGEYLISAGITRRELLFMFTSGQVRTFDVTLVEGQTLAEAMAVLNDHAKLTSPLDDKAFQVFLDDLGVEGNPEGLFYPDTYFFQSGDSVASILTRARSRLIEVLDEEWRKRDAELPYKTPYEALIMASLVEKETGVSWEREAIAGVFVRRLQKGMRLQTDPTVIYGQGEKYTGNITRKMLKQRTPYNTYMINGLPPTPIAFVGREAIQAALHPEDGDSLYFVAKGDGTHYFSKNLAEHNRAVRKYQIYQRREDYRSTVTGSDTEKN